MLAVWAAVVERHSGFYLDDSELPASGVVAAPADPRDGWRQSGFRGSTRDVVLGSAPLAVEPVSSRPAINLAGAPVAEVQEGADLLSRLPGFAPTTTRTTLPAGRFLSPFPSATPVLSGAPVTSAPVTTAPATSAPGGSATTSLPPTTEPPTSQPPTTSPPATQPPATEPPATEPPATEPPATEPPATEPPATEPPATEPPATEPPATEPPSSTTTTLRPDATAPVDDRSGSNSGRG
jgi:hypothetical protein